MGGLNGTAFTLWIPSKDFLHADSKKLFIEYFLTFTFECILNSYNATGLWRKQHSGNDADWRYRHFLNLWKWCTHTHNNNKVTPCVLTMSTARNKILCYEGSHPAGAVAIESADANPCVYEFQKCQHMYVTIAT